MADNDSKLSPSEVTSMQPARKPPVFIGAGHLVDQEMTLDGDVRHVLGPDLTLERCKVILKKKHAATLAFRGVRLLDCEIQMRPRLGRFDWESVELIGCRFFGGIGDQQMGHNLEWGAHGCVQRCDFSKAKISNLALFESPADQHVWPPWPVFVMRDPLRHRERILSHPWPGRLSVWASAVARVERSPGETASVHDGEFTAKRFNVTQDELHSALESLGDDVVLIR